MKLIFCVCLSFILSNFCVDSGIVNEARKLGENFVRERIDYAKHSIQQRVEDDPLLSSAANYFGREKILWFNFKKTKFTDLNLDCVFLILEHLDLPELLNVAQINDKFSTVAAAVFRLQYSHLPVLISDDFLFAKKPIEILPGIIDTNTVAKVLKRFGVPIKEMPSIGVYNDAIVIDESDAISLAFKHFGRVIRTFKYKSYSWFREPQKKLVGNLISNYSSESLTDVELSYSDYKLFEHITKPLINVETVTFTECNLKNNPKNVRLNEIFPAVRRLNLHLSPGGELYRFNFHMPLLEDVSMEGLSLDYSIGRSPFMEVIMNNPQIRSIRLYDASPEFLQEANAFLPQLESLTLSHFALNDGSIQFENVTTLNIELPNASPTNLHFPRLQTLRISYTEQHLAQWLNFLHEHNHLSHLRFDHTNFDDLQFQQLTANLTDLVELTIQPRHDPRYDRHQHLGANAIVEFLKSHENVNRLNIFYYPTDINEALEKQLKTSWTIKYYGACLSFERKN